MKMKEQVPQLGGQAGPDSVSMDPVTYGKYLTRQFGLPGLLLEDGELLLTPPGEATRALQRPPRDKPGEISEAFAHLERYLGTVDRHGQTNEPEAVKAHMLDVLPYFFWASSATEQVRMLTRRGGSTLDKRLPFLYLQGESNSGKGTFLSSGSG